MDGSHLMGVTRCPLAENWRFTVPLRWRSILAPGSALVMMPDPRIGALCIYPSTRFQALATAVMARNEPGATEQLLDACEPCDVDRRGRIAIPKVLRRAWPSAQGELVLAGQGDHVELWSAPEFERRRAGAGLPALAWIPSDDEGLVVGGG